MREQIIQTVDTEVEGLAEHYATNGINGLTMGISRRVQKPDANLYLLTDFAGNYLAGNIRNIPKEILAQSDGQIKIVNYSRDLPGEGQNKSPNYTAVVRVFSLPGNFNLLVGRDLEEQSRLHDLLAQALTMWLVVMVLMAAITWFFVNRRVLRRIDRLTIGSHDIMAGNLSGRLEVTGNGDEFDRLAINLNAMLARIEELMHELKQVSDNIAHDLKTPLTRMRGRVEGALRQQIGATEAKKSTVLRQALEETLVETDDLISTFNALLRIARVEAGASGVYHNELQLDEVLSDIAELYIPLAEESPELTIKLIQNEKTKIKGDRELLSQALANVLDNALKYGRSEQADTQQEITISLSQQNQRAYIEITDNGPGIDESDRERVCQRFVRLDASRSQQGAGLGMSLIKAVVSLHNGEMHLTDNKPGLKITLEFPILQEKAHNELIARIS